MVGSVYKTKDLRQEASIRLASRSTAPASAASMPVKPAFKPRLNWVNRMRIVDQPAETLREALARSLSVGLA